MTDEERAARVEEIRHELAQLCNGYSPEQARFLLAELDRVTAQEEETAKAFEVLMHDMAEERDAALAQVEQLREALTPSASTKAAFIGEFRFTCDEGHEVVVPWTTVKEVMAAVLNRAATEPKP